MYIPRSKRKSSKTLTVAYINLVFQKHFAERYRLQLGSSSLWTRTSFNQPDWLNCFSSFHAACVEENLHSESETGYPKT